MKKLPITLYITIWYAAFMIIVLGILIGVITYTSNVSSNEQARDRISDQVLNLSENIRYSEGDFRFNEDIQYLIKGVYLSVYDEDGKMLEGQKAISVGNYPKLKDGKLFRELSYSGDYWYMFDKKFQIDGKDIWIRGVAMDQTNAGSGSNLFLNLRWVLIIIAIVSIIGGLIMARNAMKPVRKVIRTVEEIRDDGDLSRRVSPGKRRDEISQLADSFNGMFDNIEKTMKSEKQFTSDVSHELRTPLSVIISNSDYALTDESYREEALQTINKEARRMSTLVSKLLTLSRSDAGKLPLNFEYINLSELCHGVAEQQLILVKDEKVTINTEIQPGVFAYCDESFIIRALLNLVDNAMTYGTDGENPTITIGLYKYNDMAVISVRDNGMGITEAHQEKIWERFYRVDQSRSERGSSGLGLSMVKMIARNHGGTVDVKSSPGNGARFEIRIPLSREVSS